jgi:hypothetical protein
MALSKTVKRYLIFYGIVVLLLGSFLAAHFLFLWGDLGPGETRIFQASVFVNKLSDDYTVEAPDFLEVRVANIHDYGFYVEYQRQPRTTFDYQVTAAPDAKPGVYEIALTFANDFTYRDWIRVKRNLF